jgi:DNA polymerase elongation subunit (family B)
VCPASRFAVNNASLLAVYPPSIRSLIAAPNPLLSFDDFTALQYVGPATATSCMQKAKQLGLCDDDMPPSVRVYKPKPGSAQEAALRALMSVQAHSDAGRHSAVSSELVDSPVGSGAQRRMVRVASSNVVLAIDIETGGDGISFPDKGEHPVFQISCLVNQVGCDQPSSQTLFTWKPTAAITGVDLVVMEDEAAMLTRFSSFVIQINPDVIIGFNVCAFDLKYLIERMQKLRLSSALCIGRMEGSPMRFVTRSPAERVFLFKDGSYSRGVEVFIPGRVVHDVYHWITNQHHFIKTVSNPRPYSLDACALHFLKDSKAGVKWQQIVPMFNGTDDDRRALAVYCLKDAQLALRLMNLLSTTCPEVKRFFEVTGLPAHTVAAVAAVCDAPTNAPQPPVVQTDANQVERSIKRQRGALGAASDDGDDDGDD